MNEVRDKIYKELRQKFDSCDPFLAGGHRDIKVRRGSKQIPDWVNDYAFIRRVLLRAFPKLDTSIKQRKAAGKWIRVIQLYWRKQLTHGQIRFELGESVNGEFVPLRLTAVQAIIRNIRRAINGDATNGKKTKVKGSRGRPKGAKDSYKRKRLK